MAERDLGAAFFNRDIVENATTQTRADRAVSLAFGHETFDDRIGVALDDAKRNVAPFQI